MKLRFYFDGVVEKVNFRVVTIGMLSLLVVATVPLSAGAQVPPAAQESPWATRAPATPIPGMHESRVNVIHSSESAVTPEQRALAEKYVKAVQARDAAQIRTLLPPSTLKCFDKSKEPYLDDWIEKQFRFPISKDHKLSVSVLPPEITKPSRIATYPVPATHLLGFDYSADGSNITLNQEIGQEGGNWYLVAPCPTELGMERFAKIEKMRAAGRARAERVIKEIKEPLKSQLLALIAKHDNADAWKLCVRSLHIDFLTAQAVVAKLAGEDAD